MLVAAIPLKIGQGYRNPGEPVAEYAGWPASVQRRLFLRQHVRDVSEAEAASMREAYARRLGVAAKQVQERQFEQLQHEAALLMAKEATSAKAAAEIQQARQEAEEKLLNLAGSLGVDIVELEPAALPADSGTADPRAPDADPLPPAPQMLANLVEMTKHDLCEFMLHTYDVQMQQTMRREKLVGEAMRRLYGEDWEALAREGDDAGE